MGAQTERQGGITRRQFLQGAATAGVVLAAGCENPDSLQTAGVQASLALALALDEPLTLPLQPQDTVLKEVVRSANEYVYARAIRTGKRSFPVLAVYKRDSNGGERLITEHADTGFVHYYSYAVSPDAKRLAVVAELEPYFSDPDVAVELYNLETGEETYLRDSTGRDFTISSGNFSDPPHRHSPDVLRWSHDGSNLAFTWAGTVHDVRNREMKLGEKRAGKETFTIQDLIWSPTRNELLHKARHTGRRDEGIFLWTQEGGRDIPLRKLDSLINHTYATPLNAEWRPDGEAFAIQDDWFIDGEKIKIVSRAGDVVQSIPFKRPVGKIVWSPNGAFLAAHSGDGMLTIFQTDGSPALSTPIPNAHFVSWPTQETMVIAQDRRILLLPTKELLEGKIDARNENLGATKVVAFNQKSRIVALDGAKKSIVLGVTVGEVRINAADNYSHMQAERDANLELMLVDVKTAEAKPIGVGKGVIALTPRAEQERMPALATGDVLEVGPRHYRFVNGKLFEIADYEEFKRRTEPRGEVIRVNEAAIKAFPRGEIDEIVVIDWAGRGTNRGRNGGKKTAFYGGLLTGGGTFFRPRPQVDLDETFSPVINELKRNGHTDGDLLFYTYNRKKKLEMSFGYEKTDTMQDPMESIEMADELNTEWENAYPLENRVDICHSFVGIPGLFALEKHMGTKKAVVFIDCPIFGLGPLTDNHIRERLLEIAGENVVRFLLQAGRSGAYQERVRKILREAKEKGIGIYTFASTEDLIVPWQSAYWDGSTDTIDGQKIELVFPMGRSFWLFDNDYGHGSPLSNTKMLEYIPAIVGRN